MEYLANIDCSKKTLKQEALERLFSLVFENNLTLMVVKTRVGLFERLKKTPLKLATFGSFHIYAVSSSTNARIMMEYLMLQKLWHISEFHLLICRKQAEEKILMKCHKNNLNLQHCKELIADDVLAAIDPLDNILEFYCKETFRELILKKFKDKFNNKSTF